jgi:lipopolysaccharide transport system permease protein
MLHVVTAFQNVMVFDQPPQLGALAVVTAFTVMLMAFALFLVRRASPELVEAL